MVFRRAVPVAVTVFFLLGTTVAVSTLRNGSIFPLLVIPVILWGVSSGVAGGVISATVASAYTSFYIVAILGHVHNVPYVLVAVTMFLGVGWTVGKLADMYARIQEQEGRIAVVNRELEQAVDERSLLLVEVHHRIKNDMNFVRSLLLIQADQSPRSETQTALTEAATRVSVLAEVYQNLYTDSNFRVVEVKPLVESILNALRSGVDRGDTHLVTDIDALNVSSRESVSLGIIVNELVTNALKYACADSSDGEGREGGAGDEITVTVHRDTPRSVIVSVADCGPGFPEAMLDGSGYGYGLTIVEALAGQHAGTLKIENRTETGSGERQCGGATVTVTLQTGPPPDTPT